MMKSLAAQIGVVTLALVGIATWIAGIKSKAVSQERAAVEIKSTINANKADAARRTAEQLPADRLRDRYFRD